MCRDDHRAPRSSRGTRLSWSATSTTTAAEDATVRVVGSIGSGDHAGCRCARICLLQWGVHELRRGDGRASGIVYRGCTQQPRGVQERASRHGCQPGNIRPRRPGFDRPPHRPVDGALDSRRCQGHGGPGVVLRQRVRGSGPPGLPGLCNSSRAEQIQPVATGQTASLQALLSNLDRLLIELHPGQLDAALTALSGALVGQGTSLGNNLVDGNRYLQGMLPLWPKVVADFEAFDPVANSFSTATPDLLQILTNQTVTSKTINSSASSVRNAISGGAKLTEDAYKLFAAIQSPFKTLTADSAPFLQDLSQNPYEIADLLSGLNKFASAFLAAEANGPYLSVTVTVKVINPADLGIAILGGSPSTLIDAISSGLGAQYVNPPLYTSTDCPTLRLPLELWRCRD